MGKDSRLRLCAPAFACCVMAGCTTAGPPQVHHPPVPRPPGTSSPGGVIGSPGNPLKLSCAEQSTGAAPMMPGPDDLVIGPLDIVEGKLLATANPAGYGEHGSYKVPIAIGPGATVTVVIAAQARGRVVIDNPYGPPGGVAAATYPSCQPGWTVFAQGLAFPDRRARGCVPLDVQTGGQSRTRHGTVSLFAGSCAP